MPKLSVKLPKYRKHSSRDVAFVVLNGRRVYLTGTYGSVESKADYKARVLEWQAIGRLKSIPNQFQTHRFGWIHGEAAANAGRHAMIFAHD